MLFYRGHPARARSSTPRWRERWGSTLYDLRLSPFGSSVIPRLGGRHAVEALYISGGVQKDRQRSVFRGSDMSNVPEKASRVPVLVGGSAFGEPRGKAPAFVVDLTKRRRRDEARRELEADLAHTNRLSIMGELTASLAHEITQPVASARNNARAALNFLDKRPPDLDEIRQALGCVVDDTDRAGNIIDRIRDQVKKAPPRKERFDLKEAINEVIVLARSAITKNSVSVQIQFTDGLLPVRGDRVQLQQVALNLILNAVDAMSSVEAAPRDLVISTEETQAHVLVKVCDCGPGIDRENLDRIFEAFYTTKPGGVGMGLSICRSIIDAHGGRLWAEANEPRGAVLQFTLPNAENS
jgi:C4-dicarboxylate-specific signal transduction histidine kinase